MTKNNNFKIQVETKSLSHALTFANSVVEKRNVSTELSHIKLVVKNNELELVATDSDMYLTQKIFVQAFEEGEITVSTKTLTEIIKKIPDKDIIITVITETEQLEICSKNCTFSLLTLPGEQFPMVEEVTVGSILKIPCRDLAKIIDSTKFSVSTEETRYNLNGIYLHVTNTEQGHKFCAASTDGHRLSVSSIEIDSIIEEFGVIVPRKTVEEILKIIKDPKNAQSDIEICLSINRIKFICNNIIMISKIIDGTFPNYLSFIPVENNHKLTVNPKLLADAIDRVATITVDKFRAIKVKLARDKIEITASGEAKGAANEVIVASQEADNLCIFDSENELLIGFNPKYLTDVLEATKFKQVELYFSDASSPTLIKVPESANDIFVIMPVKV